MVKGGRMIQRMLPKIFSFPPPFLLSVQINGWWYTALVTRARYLRAEITSNYNPNRPKLPSSYLLFPRPLIHYNLERHIHDGFISPSAQHIRTIRQRQEGRVRLVSQEKGGKGDFQLERSCCVRDVKKTDNLATKVTFIRGTWPSTARSGTAKFASWALSTSFSSSATRESLVSKRVSSCTVRCFPFSSASSFFPLFPIFPAFYP